MGLAPQAPVIRAGDKRHACEHADCGLQFSTAGHLARHLRTFHSAERPFPCGIGVCRSRFSRLDNCRQHRLLHFVGGPRAEIRRGRPKRSRTVGDGRTRSRSPSRGKTELAAKPEPVGEESVQGNGQGGERENVDKMQMQMQYAKAAEEVVDDVIDVDIKLEHDDADGHRQFMQQQHSQLAPRARGVQRRKTDESVSASARGRSAGGSRNINRAASGILPPPTHQHSQEYLHEQEYEHQHQFEQEYEHMHEYEYEYQSMHQSRGVHQGTLIETDGQGNFWAVHPAAPPPKSTAVRAPSSASVAASVSASASAPGPAPPAPQPVPVPVRRSASRPHTNTSTTTQTTSQRRPSVTTASTHLHLDTSASHIPPSDISDTSASSQFWTTQHVMSSPTSYADPTSPLSSLSSSASGSLPQKQVQVQISEREAQAQAQAQVQAQQAQQAWHDALDFSHGQVQVHGRGVTINEHPPHPLPLPLPIRREMSYAPSGPHVTYHQHSLSHGKQPHMEHQPQPVPMHMAYPALPPQHPHQLGAQLDAATLLQLAGYDLSSLSSLSHLSALSQLQSLTHQSHALPHITYHAAAQQDTIPAFQPDMLNLELDMDPLAGLELVIDGDGGDGGADPAGTGEAAYPQTQPQTHQHQHHQPSPPLISTQQALAHALLARMQMQALSSPSASSSVPSSLSLSLSSGSLGSSCGPAAIAPPDAPPDSPGFDPSDLSSLTSLSPPGSGMSIPADIAKAAAAIAASMSAGAGAAASAEGAGYLAQWPAAHQWPHHIAHALHQQQLPHMAAHHMQTPTHPHTLSLSQIAHLSALSSLAQVPLPLSLPMPVPMAVPGHPHAHMGPGGLTGMNGINGINGMNGLAGLSQLAAMGAMAPAHVMDRLRAAAAAAGVGVGVGAGVPMGVAEFA